MSATRVLIVEDEAVVQLHLSRIIKNLGYQVTGVAASAAQALELAATMPPDLVLMDIRLRGNRDGIATARELQAQCDPAIVFLTAYADEETVARTEQVGAMGYIVKPYSNNEVRAVLATALVLREQFLRLSDEARDPGLARPAAKPRGTGDEPHGMIGESTAMQEIFARIAKVARIDWPVLIEGETGTGKEMTARALHRQSARAAGPFVAVNCAGLTESLLGSLLFGHRKGTFTGAVTDQPGFFEAADGGVLFLDEIADVSAGAQKALLRVLEDGLVQRVGETTTRPVDVRIVSATQRDLGAEVAAGRFRADLLFRLRAVRISLPPLRERQDDLSKLAEAFLERAARTVGRPSLRLAPETITRLRAYDWPGNVRELMNAINHAALSCRGDVIGSGDLPPEITGRAAPLVEGRDQLTAGDERQQILSALARAKGNRTLAAALLGISRATLYRRFEAHGIDPDTNFNISG